ncbi:hypothetical protein [Superficieibacter sp. 1612_C1]|uniref:hypothetical protein n=1 Tax=Superficieibacter sp. 1612_C1 TaxID=2780382 RepID=UPI0018834A06|nr:hypothetical protein [Superficieibacter sp. 1612_C1]
MQKKIGLLPVLALLLSGGYWLNIAQRRSDPAHKKQVVEIYAGLHVNNAEFRFENGPARERISGRPAQRVQATVSEYITSQ